MRLLGAYLAVVMIWSTTPLAIKFSNDSLSFISAVGLRMLLAAIVCVMLCVWRRCPLRWDRQAMSAYAAANLGLYGAMSLVSLATATVPSGVVSLMFGLAPLISGVLAVPLLNEPPLSAIRIVALFTSIGGLALVLAGDTALAVQAWPGLLACLIAVCLFALSGVLVKRQAVNMGPLEHTTGSLLFSLPLFGLSWWLLDGQAPQFSMLSAGAVVYLALMGSVLGFMLYFMVLQHLGPTRVALIPLMTPAIALMLGQWVAGEEIGQMTVLGAGVIVFALGLFQADGKLRGLWRRRTPT